MEVDVADEHKDHASAPGGVDKSKTVHIYDGDLFEEDNELPNWWLWPPSGDKPRPG